MASEQECPGRSRGREGERHSRARPEDQGHHRKKAGDSGRTPPDRSIQCWGEGRTGGTSGTRRRRCTTGREGREAPGQRASSRSPQASGKGRSGTLVARRTQWPRAQDPGSAGTGHEGGAATRARAAQASKWEHATGNEDRRQDECNVPRLDVNPEIPNPPGGTMQNNSVITADLTNRTFGA